MTYVPTHLPSARVFTPAEEQHIVEYTIIVAKLFYGLPRDTFRKLVYQYAVACKKSNIPEVWKVSESATRDWYYAFMLRHPNLALKEPEGMSIARIVAFNKVNVDKFFDALTLALEKYEITPDRIYNLDESALATVMKPTRVVCARGQPVASQVSRERGETMTFVGIISAVGRALPPVFIIPRKKWNAAFMRGTTYGSKGILQPSGWMTGEVFVETLQHVKQQTGCSVEQPICLIIDNAECHMNIHVVEYAETNGIKIVTLPPHTTDKLQPLDVSVFGPFKGCLKRQQTSYNIMHPNEHITLHQLPQFACEAWTTAANPLNIISGFRATGICPLNRDIFPEDAFVAAQVTERVEPPMMLPVVVTATASDEEDDPAVVEAPHVSPTDSPSMSGEVGSVADAVAGPSGLGDVGTPSRSLGLPSPELALDAGMLGTPTEIVTPPARLAAVPGPSSASPSAGLAAVPGPSSPSHHVTPGAFYSTPKVGVLPLTSIRPLPRAPERPYVKGRKRVSY